MGRCFSKEVAPVRLSEADPVMLLVKRVMQAARRAVLLKRLAALRDEPALRPDAPSARRSGLRGPRRRG
eukprot:scaffold117111_cov53-Phaeocystis_antarctica.AAC.1